MYISSYHENDGNHNLVYTHKYTFNLNPIKNVFILQIFLFLFFFGQFRDRCCDITQKTEGAKLEAFLIGLGFRER
jgi:hypothetical protein